MRVLKFRQRLQQGYRPPGSPHVRYRVSRLLHPRAKVVALASNDLIDRIVDLGQDGRHDLLAGFIAISTLMAPELISIITALAKDRVIPSLTRGFLADIVSTCVSMLDAFRPRASIVTRIGNRCSSLATGLISGQTHLFGLAVTGIASPRIVATRPDQSSQWTKAKQADLETISPGRNLLPFSRDITYMRASAFRIRRVGHLQGPCWTTSRLAP